MSIKEAVQAAMIAAMKAKDTARLETLRMAKGALLLREKEGAAGTELSEAEAAQAIRSEIKKRRQTIEALQDSGRAEAISETEAEIQVLEEFLPRQLSAEEIEARVRAYLEAHPETAHPGKLTGIMKQALGEQADGKVLNEVCRKVLG